MAHWSERQTPAILSQNVGFPASSRSVYAFSFWIRFGLDPAASRRPHASSESAEVGDSDAESGANSLLGGLKSTELDGGEIRPAAPRANDPLDPVRRLLLPEVSANAPDASSSRQ